MIRLLLLSLCCLPTLTWAFSEPDLVSLLQQPQNTQGDFQQQRFLKNLPKPISTTGKFTLVKARGLLWQTEKPFMNQLRVTAEGISQWDGNQWQTQQKLGQKEQVRLFLGLLSGDIQALRAQFDLKLQGDKTAWQLVLLPNSLLMKQIFEQIEIQGDQIVKRIELREKQGDRTVILFHHTQIDQPLPMAVQQALP